MATPVRRGNARPQIEPELSGKKDTVAMAAVSPGDAEKTQGLLKPAPSLGSYQESPYYAPERGGNHPAPRVLGQAYVTQEQREARLRELKESGELGPNAAGAGAAGGAGAAAGAAASTGSTGPGHSGQELHEKTIIESAYAAGVKKLAEERGLGVEHQRSRRSHETGASHGSSGASHASADAEPVVEVIGIADREKAQKVALKATRDLERRGENVAGAKIVVDANKRDIYIEHGGADALRTRESEQEEKAKSAPGGVGAGASRSAATGPAASGAGPVSPVPEGPGAGAGIAAAAAPSGPLAGTSRGAHSGTAGATAVGAAGAAGVYAGSQKHNAAHPDASFADSNPRDVDPRQFHNQHEEVKEELEEFAQEGRLGAVEPHQTSGASAPGTAFAASSHHAGHSHTGHSHTGHSHPDAAFDEANPREVDPRQFHAQHEHVKHELEEFAEEHRLGDVGVDHTPASGTSRAAAGGVAGATAGVAGLGLAHHAQSPQTSQSHPDATFHQLNPGDVDPRRYHQQHEEVKQELEDLAREGTLGNISATLASGYREPYPSTSTGASGDAAGHSDVPMYYQNVKVLGVKDHELAKDLARQAANAVQGRNDIVQAKELRVDKSGAVTDETGRFLIQLGRSHGLISEDRDTTAHGGLVTPPVKDHGVSQGLSSKGLSDPSHETYIGSGVPGQGFETGRASQTGPSHGTYLGSGVPGQGFDAGASSGSGVSDPTASALGAGVSPLDSAFAAHDKQSKVAMPGSFDF